MPHILVVRATVPDESNRAAFDAWYSREHLPDAVKSFGSKRAWRYWLANEPAVHLAMYEFPDRASLDAAVGGEEMKRLIRDFDVNSQQDLEQRLRGDDVLLERAAEFVRCGRARRSAGRAAGVVDEDLHGARIRRRFDFRAQRVGVAHVRRDRRMRLRSVNLRQFLQRFVEPVARAREQGHVGAELGEFDGSGEADALRAAADERVLAGEVEVHA